MKVAQRSMCTGEHVTNSGIILSNSSVQKQQSNKQKVFKATRTIEIFQKDFGGNSFLIVEIPLFFVSCIFYLVLFIIFFLHTHTQTHIDNHTCTQDMFLMCKAIVG